jgi:hypothetical protein
VRAAIDAVRPIGILPKIEPAQLVGAGFQCNISVEGLPIPGGTPTAINTSAEALALKGRIFDRVRRYTDSLSIGEPVRFSEVLWAIMEEPGVTDAKQLRLRRYPPLLDATGLFEAQIVETGPQVFNGEEDVTITPTEIADFVADPTAVVIV